MAGAGVDSGSSRFGLTSSSFFFFSSFCPADSSALGFEAASLRVERDRVTAAAGEVVISSLSISQIPAPILTASESVSDCTSMRPRRFDLVAALPMMEQTKLRKTDRNWTFHWNREQNTRGALRQRSPRDIHDCHDEISRHKERVSRSTPRDTTPHLLKR